MKFLLVLSLSLFPFIASAQRFTNRFLGEQRSGLLFGAKLSAAAGIMDFENITPLPGKNAINLVRYHFDAGFYLELKPEEGLVGGQTELFYGSRGGRITYNGGSYNFQTNYLFVPFLVKAYIPTPRIEVYGGPQIGYLVAGTFTKIDTSKGGSGVVTNTSTANLKHYYNSISFEVTGGLTYHITPELSVDARGSINFISPSNYASPPFNGFIMKNIQVGLRYFFDLNAFTRAERLQF